MACRSSRPGVTKRIAIHGELWLNAALCACPAPVSALGSRAMEFSARICIDVSDRARLPWRFHARRAGTVQAG